MERERGYTDPTMPHRYRALPKSPSIPEAKDGSPMPCLFRSSTIRKESRVLDIHILRSRIILKGKDWYPLGPGDSKSGRPTAVAYPAELEKT